MSWDPHDLIGRTVSHYKVTEKLGEGGMGVVYKAEDIKLKRIVALKFLLPDAVGSPEHKARFLLEAQAAAALDHPNICTIYEIDEFEGQPFLVMAYIDGKSVKEKVRSGPLEPQEATEIAIAVARGLADAHEKGMVHRDIKSANILVTGKRQAKITDFGLALLAERTQITLVGTTLGTVSYMSPEQARGERVDPRADIWALGVVVYEMVTGELPFRGEREAAVVHAILYETPAAPGSLRAGLPEGFERLLSRALAKNLSERYSRIEEMLADLEALRRYVETTSTMTGSYGWGQQRQRRRRYLWAGVAALLVLGAGAGAWLWFGVWRQKAAARQPAFVSIAVLPLENLSRDPEQEYFTEGMTRALIAHLAKIRALRVVSRTSVLQYKGSKRPIREIARELTVDAVVEGSVLRAGDKVSITAQLIAASTEQVLWAESYERDARDVLALQSEVARAIAHEIRIKLTPQEDAGLSAAAATVNPQAYEAYLKGRHYWNRRTEEGLKKGMELFQRAIAEDPKYAPSYAGVADSWFLLAWSGAVAPREAMPKAKEAALEALKINDNLAEALNSLAGVRQLYEWDWKGAEEAFRRAIDLDPGYADAHHRYAMILLGPLGRMEEAAAEMRRAQDLDPLSLVIRTNFGRPLYYSRKFDEAIQHYRSTIELDPSFFRAYWELGRVYEQKGMCREALEAFEQAKALSQSSPLAVGALGHAFALCGKTQEAQRVARELASLSKGRYVSPFDTALIYAGLNDKPRAFEWLEKAYQERSVWMVYLKVDPRLDRLRSTPEFQQLLKKVGLEQ